MLGEEFMATGEGESTEFLFALKLRDKKICFYFMFSMTDEKHRKN